MSVSVLVLARVEEEAIREDQERTSQDKARK